MDSTPDFAFADAPDADGGTFPTPTRLIFASPAPGTPAGGSTPAGAGASFNPDDFFASPPHPAPRSRGTPECKRRLFLPAGDAGLSTPRATLAAPPTVFTPLRHALAAHAAGASPAGESGSSFLTYGILATPRGAGLPSLPPPPAPPSLAASGSKKRARAGRAPGDASATLASFSAPVVQSSPSISSFLSPHTSLLPAPDSLAATLATSPRPRFTTPAPTTAPPPPPFMTPITPSDGSTKCSCKASRCLKLYCPCFAASGMCAPGCTCKNCQNTPATLQAITDARATVLARDPKAFLPKRRSARADAAGDIHAKGCNCRKGCGKNYCVCRELRVSCGPRCTCSGPAGCLNGKMGATPAGIAPAPARFRTSLPETKPVVRRVARVVPKARAPQKITMQSLRASMPAAGASVSQPAPVAPPKQEAIPAPPAPPAAPAPAAASPGGPSPGGLFGTPDALRRGGLSLFSTPNALRRLAASSPARPALEALTSERLLARKRAPTVSVDALRADAAAAVAASVVKAEPEVTEPKTPPARTLGVRHSALRTPDAPPKRAPALATSPATELRGSTGGREQARPPRILRVKMGSGRALRKFAVGGLD